MALKHRPGRNLALFNKWHRPAVTPTAGGNWRIARNGTTYYGKGLNWEWTRSEKNGGDVRNPFVLSELNALVTMRVPVPAVKAKEDA